MNDKVSILIVDDETGMRETLYDILEDMGYHTAIAVDGHEAIQKVKDNAFDVIFMDVKMPGMDGVETFKEIKKIRPETAVVIMTAYAVDNLVREAQREGIYDVIHKPFDIKRMLGLIEGVVEALRKDAYTCLYKPFDVEEVVKLVDTIRRRKRQGGERDAGHSADFV